MKTESPGARRPARNPDGTFRAATTENLSKTILDLAHRIEERGRERFAEKSKNLRVRVLDLFRNHYPHSNDETLLKVALATLRSSPPGEEVIFAEIRELNVGMIAGSERELVPCPIPEPEEK